MPLTGTTFEYFDCLAANDIAAREGRPGIPMLVYFVGLEATISDQSRAPFDRGFGGGRWERRIETETQGSLKRQQRQLYDRQLVELAAFFDTFILSRQRGAEKNRPVTFIEDPTSFGTILERDLSRVLNLHRSYAVDTVVKGLRSYAPADYPFFLGRRGEINALVAQLSTLRERREPLATIVEAPSGAGKTSLLGAGLVGGIRRGCFNARGPLRAALVTPHQLVRAASARAAVPRDDAVFAELMVRVVEAFAEDGAKDVAETRDLYTGLDTASAVSRALTALESLLARTAGTRIGAADSPLDSAPLLVLVLDQFERVLDDRVAGGEQAQLWQTTIAFLNRLIGSKRCWVVCAIPDTRLQLWNELALLDCGPSMFHLRNPGRAALEEIARGMAELLRVSLEPELLHLILESLHGYEVSTARSRLVAGGVPVLPLLSRGLERIFDEWDRRRRTCNTADTVLRVADYGRFGDLSQVIEELCKQASRAALRERSRISFDERLLHTLLDHLVSVPAKKYVQLEVCAIEEIHSDDPESIRAMIDSFIEARILVSLDGRHIMLAHEVVLDKWSMARAWFEEKKDDLLQLARLEEAAKLWESQPPEERERYLERNPVALQFAGYALWEWRHRLTPAVGQFARESLRSGYDVKDDMGSAKEGATLVTYAALSGDRELLERYIARAKSQEILHREPWSALAGACYGGHTELCRWCLENGANLQERTKEGWSLLHLAAARGHASTVAMLLERGLELDARDNDGRTPLHVACQGSVDVVNLLLDRGADLGATDRGRSNVLHLYARSGAVEAIVALAARRPAEIEALSRSLDDASFTPLFVALHRRQSDAAVALIEAVGDGGGELAASSLDWALAAGDWRVGAMLLARGMACPPSIVAERFALFQDSDRSWTEHLESALRGSLLGEGGARTRRPILRGPWQELERAELSELLLAFIRDESARDSPSMATLYRFHGARRQRPSFYPGMELIDADVSDGGDVPGYAFLRGPDRFVALDRSNRPIYDLNATGALDLSSAEQAAEYIRFFFAIVTARHGTFDLVEGVDDLAWEGDDAIDSRATVAKHLRPGELELDQGTMTYSGRWTFLFKRCLFVSRVWVDPAGIITMSEEELLVEDLPLTSSTRAATSLLRYS